MRISRIRRFASASTLLSACALTAAVVAGAGTTAAVPNPDTSTGARERCVVDPADDARTVDALMNHCSASQILALFEGAELGAVPTGTKTISLLPMFQVDGKPLPDRTARLMTRAQSNLGKTLTFTTRDGGPWVYKDYLWGRDIGSAVVPSVSRIDGKPVYAADFARDFLGVELSRHEYRQLTPGVWIGRDIGGGDKPTDTPTGGAIALH